MKLSQIVCPAGFGSSAGHFKSAEWMAADDRAGDGAIDVEVSDQKFRTHAIDVLRAARVEASSESERCVIGNLDGRRQIFGEDHGENRSEDFFLRQTRGRFDRGKDCRRNVISFKFWRELSLQGEMMFAFAQLDVSLDLSEGVPIDDGADVRIWMFRKPDLERCDRFDQPRNQSFVDIAHRDQPRQCGTFLTLEIEGGMENAENGFVKVSIGIDDHRVFAAHFADHFFQISLISMSN